jgi:hypothetical protein
MQVHIKFAVNPASASTEPQLTNWLLRIPERWAGPLARIYTSAFVYGLAFYLTGWVLAFWFFVPPGARFGRAVLFIAATGWIPFLYLYALFTGWIVARLRRNVEAQREAIESLENDFGDVIGEAVTIAVSQIQRIGPEGNPDTSLDKYFGRH